MIKKLKENETDFVRDCSLCGGSFIYNRSDYFSPYDTNFVKCPYCGSHQRIWFHRVYKSDAEKQEDYKQMVEDIKKEKEREIRTRNDTIVDLRNKIDNMNKERQRIENRYDSKAINMNSTIERLEQERTRQVNLIQSLRDDFDRVCQEKINLEDELESLKSTIDKLGIVIKEDAETDLVEPIDEVGDVPKKKKTKKKVEERVEE